MRDLERIQGDRHFWMTRGQLAALGVAMLAVSALAFFVGVMVGQKGQHSETVAQATGLVAAEVQDDALTELLARVEQAAASPIPTPVAGASQLTYPERLVAPVAEVAVPEEPIIPDEELQALVVEAPVAEAPEPPDEPALDEELPTGGWAVQVFSFESAAEAETRLASVRDGGLDAYRVDAMVGGVTRYRVRVGPYGSEADAREALGQVSSSLGVPDAIVVRAP
jgi:DedD protein